MKKVILDGKEIEIIDTLEIGVEEFDFLDCIDSKNPEYTENEEKHG